MCSRLEISQFLQSTLPLCKVMETHSSRRCLLKPTSLFTGCSGRRSLRRTSSENHPVMWRCWGRHTFREASLCPPTCALAVFHSDASAQIQSGTRTAEERASLQQPTASSNRDRCCGEHSRPQPGLTSWLKATRFRHVFIRLA